MEEQTRKTVCDDAWRGKIEMESSGGVGRAVLIVVRLVWVLCRGYLKLRKFQLL